MAEKSYNVRLNVQVAEAITNIDQILKRVQTLNETITDLDESEIAFNVVVRNLGFQNMVANLNKFLLKMEKDSEDAGNKIGEGIEKGINSTGNKLANNGLFSKATRQIAQNIKGEVEGSLKGLDSALSGTSKNIQTKLNAAFDDVGAKIEKTIAESVTKGMAKGLRGLTAGATQTFNTQLLTFKTNFSDLDSGLGRIRDTAEHLDEIVAGLRKVAEALNNLTGGDRRRIYDQSLSMAREIAKTSAHDVWSETHMSLKDQAHLDVENRKLDQSERLLNIQSVAQAYAEEREQIKLTNEEKRKELKLQNDLNNANKIAQSRVDTQSRQQELIGVQIKREEAKLEEQEQKTLNKKVQLREQYEAIETYARKESTRTRIQDTELEKQLYAYQKASLRVLQQQKSTQRGLHVDISAIVQGAKEKRDAEISATQEVLKQVQGYNQIKKSGAATVKSLQQTATALQRWSSAVSSVGGILSTFRQLSTTMASAISKAGSTFLGYARQAASSISSAASEQYRQLELAQIGFTNFYGEDTAKQLIKQIKEQAMKAPGVDAGDLADYVKQLAPVSKGNAQQALDAALGMLKSIQYGGSEASEEMEYVIKNVRDVIAKGTATAIDLRQFNRAMPIMEQLLESIGKSEFIKNGVLKIDKTNAKDLLSAFAAINTDPSSPAADIYDKMANTLDGIKDIIKQTFITRFNDTLIDLGFYDKVKTILKDLSESGAIEKFYNFLANAANKILDFLRSLDWGSITTKAIEGAKNIWQAIKDVVKSIMDTLNSTDLASLVSKVLNAVASFIRGFGEGINKVIQFINSLEKKFGPDTINNLSNLMGLLASPLGSLAQKGISLVSNSLGFASRTTYNLAAKYQAKVENKLASIDASVKQLVTAGKLGANNPVLQNDTLVNMGIKRSLDGSMVVQGGNMAKNTAWLWNKSDGTFASQQSDGTWRTAGGLQNLSTKDRLTSIGDGSLLKGTARVGSQYVKSAFNAFKTAAGKLVKSFAIYETGKAISSVAGMIATSATGNSDLGNTVSEIGDIISAGVALGTQFGLVGAAAGIAIEGLKKFAEGAKDVQEAATEYAKKVRNSMYEESATSIMNTLIAAFSEQGKYTAGDEIDADAQAKMYDGIIADLKAKKSVDEIIKNAQEKYFTTRATSIARRDLTERTSQVDFGEKVTPLTDKSSPEGLREAYRRLDRQNLITTDLMRWARSTMGDEAVRKRGVELDDMSNENYEKLLQSLTPTELMNYLKKNGLDISSEQAVTAFLSIAEGTLKEFLENKKYNADLTFSIASAGKEYNSWEELLVGAGFVRDDKYGWVLKAKLELTQVADDDADKTKAQRLGEVANNEFAHGNWVGGLVNGFLSGLFGIGAPEFKKFAGGPIKPIYRAGGGDTLARGVDTVPIMAQPGEFVMRKTAVNKLGMGVLNALNIGDLGKAAQLLGSKFTGNWNNSRAYNHNVSTVNKYVTNNVSVTNRTRGGMLNSYNSLANRLAQGF